jgi:hypothetical protein
LFSPAKYGTFIQLDARLISNAWHVSCPRLYERQYTGRMTIGHDSLRHATPYLQLKRRSVGWTSLYVSAELCIIKWVLVCSLPNRTSIHDIRTCTIRKITVFWDVAPCSLVEIYRRFRGRSPWRWRH